MLGFTSIIVVCNINQLSTSCLLSLILTVALSALVAWSRLKPMDTMVARCSSERLSVGVVPGPELQPGKTRGAEKSGTNKRIKKTMKTEQMSQNDNRLICLHMYLNHPYGS